MTSTPLYHNNDVLIMTYQNITTISSCQRGGAFFPLIQQLKVGPSCVCVCTRAPPTPHSSLRWKTQFIIWHRGAQDPLPAAGDRHTETHREPRGTNSPLENDRGENIRRARTFQKVSNTYCLHMFPLLCEWISGCFCGIMSSRLGSFGTSQLIFLHVMNAFLKTNIINAKRGHHFYISVHVQNE